MMRSLLLSMFLVSFAFTAYSQVIWSEDFSNGIPADWGNEDLSEIGLLWTYCADTTTYGNDQVVVSCPFNFTDCENMQSHFKSNSPENGFACCVTEPFFSALGNTAFETRLTTSAIDCSNQSEVYLLFNSHIGVFDQNAFDNAFLRVSTDRVNWTSFAPFPDLQTADITEVGYRRWSFNPEKSMFDLSDIAANQETVYLQWYWEGNQEYHWSIDDIVLTYINPFPSVDISLSPDINFHALMPNFSTPISQIEPVYFLTDAVQFGLDTLRNVEIIARVTNIDNSNVLFEESVFLDELIPNENYFDIVFPPYMHEGGVGEFKVIYTISQDLGDNNPDNNFYEYPFEVTENVLRKHKPTSNTKNAFPTLLTEENLIQQRWGIANFFHIPNGAGFSVDSIYFEIPFRDDVRDSQTNINYVINDKGTQLHIKLYKWDDQNSDESATINTETITVGDTIFSISGNSAVAPIKVKLANNISADENVPLEDNTSYFLAVEFIPTSTTPFSRLFAIKASTNLNYDATIQSTSLQEQSRFAAMTSIQNSNVYDTYGFGGNVTPNIWMSVIDTKTSTPTTVLPSNAISIFPNPANEITKVTFDFEIEKGARLELLKIDGSHIRSIPIINNQAKVNCAKLANGTYLVKYNSDTSSALQKLVVLH